MKVWRHCKGFLWRRVNWDPIEGWWYACCGCGIGAMSTTIDRLSKYLDGEDATAPTQTP
jgi:hypothetical protein